MKLAVFNVETSNSHVFGTHFSVRPVVDSMIVIEQPEPMAINATLFDSVRLEVQIILHFIKPWTDPILQKHGIEWKEFEEKFKGGNGELQMKVLHRATNPALFVAQMRLQESKRCCTTNFFTFDKVFFQQACRIQVCPTWQTCKQH